MTAPFLHVDQVRIGYGAVEVIKDVSFEVARGETFAIIGPNGAGKTTLFKAVTGEAPVRAGRVLLDGADISRMPVHLRARAGLGRTFQVARVFQGLTVLANVIASVESRLRSLGRPCGPWYAWRPSAPVTREAERLLDEPTAGMSHADRLGIVELLKRLRRDKGVTVVMTEHDMDVIFNLADRILVLNHGEVIASGAPAEVRTNPLVREVYLGTEMVDAAA